MQHRYLRIGKGEQFAGPPAEGLEPCEEGAATGVEAAMLVGVAVAGLSAALAFCRALHGFIRFPVLPDPLPPARARRHSGSASGDTLVAGTYADSALKWHGFIHHKDGTLETFEAAPDASTFAVSGNASGALTGEYSDDGNPHGFIRMP